MDPWHVPEGAQTQFTEQVLQFTHSRFCYVPQPFAPEVSPPPCLKQGRITFGSFNSTAKYNAAVLQLLGCILKSVPRSRLVLKCRTFADDHYRQQIYAAFAKQEIPAERIDLRPISSHAQLLAEYADIGFCRISKRRRADQVDCDARPLDESTCSTSKGCAFRST